MLAIFEFPTQVDELQSIQRRRLASTINDASLRVFPESECYSGYADWVGFSTIGIQSLR